MTTLRATWFALVTLIALGSAPAQEPAIDRKPAPEAQKQPAAQQLDSAKPTRGSTVVQKPGVAEKPVVQKDPAAPHADKQAPAKAAPNPRALARKIQDMEKRHREVLARLERLQQVYESQGNFDKAKELELMRQQWMKRYQASMDGFRQQLGPELFAKLQALMDGRGGVPPGAGKGRGTAKPMPKGPVPPPETPPAQGEPDKGARKRGGN